MRNNVTRKGDSKKNVLPYCLSRYVPQTNTFGYIQRNATIVTYSILFGDIGNQVYMDLCMQSAD